MSKRTASRKKLELLVPLALIAILGYLVVIYIGNSVNSDKTSTVSKASRSTFLTPGDDVLSLEEDLKALGQDPAMGELKELNELE